MYYIERYTGAVGDAANIVMVEDVAVAAFESDNDCELTEQTDTDLTEFADDAIAAGRALSFGLIKSVIQQAMAEEGDWRGALTRIEDMLPEDPTI